MSELRRPSADELEALLEAHKRWVESDRAEGQQANLEPFDLSGQDLTGANLSGARLSAACFDRATLTNANLQDTDVRQTTFVDADLTNADLHGARGLSFQFLAGADLTGARLPTSVDTAVYLARLSELSGSARTTFNTLLIACGYSALTVLTITDDHLLRNASASPIPFTETEAPILWFFVLMPIIVTMIYFFFLFGLNRLWSSIKQLPAVFPDGSELTTMPQTWVLADLTHAYMSRLHLHPNKPAIAYNSLLCYFFFLFPMATLSLFWWQYIPLRDASNTFLHLTLIFASVVATMLFLWKMVWRHTLLHSRFLRVLTIALCFCISGFAGFISATVFWEEFDRVNLARDSCPSQLAVFLLCKVGHRSYVDVRHKKLSTHPSNWEDPDLIADDWVNDSDKVQRVFGPIDGVDLRGFDLSFADAQQAFLVKAWLEDAILRQADMKFADLRLAILDRADLSYAYLSSADLRRARLVETNLERAYLDDADLRGANLNKAGLAHAVLYSADLRGANLREAQARGAHLAEADLRGARLRDAVLTGAHLEYSNLEETALNQADLTGATLDHSNLRRTNLQGANLSSASLRNANLGETNLSDANLHYANLTGALLDGNESITEAQLDSACADGEVTLPERFSGRRLRSCPR